MKRFAPILVVLAIAVVLAFRAFSDPVPGHKLQRLRKGMTKDEVRTVLGPPTKAYEGGAYSHWTYARPLVSGFVNIHWQADGTFDGDVNYERF